MKSKLLIFHQHATLLPGHLLESGEVGIPDCHWLFAKDVPAGSKAILCDRKVRAWRGRDVDKVRLEIGKKLTVTRVRSCNSKTLGSSFSPSIRDIADSNDLDVVKLGQYQ